MGFSTGMDVPISRVIMVHPVVEIVCGRDYQHIRILSANDWSELPFYLVWGRLGSV